MPRSGSCFRHSLGRRTLLPLIGPGRVRARGMDDEERVHPIDGCRGREHDSRPSRWWTGSCEQTCRGCQSRPGIAFSATCQVGASGEPEPAEHRDRRKERRRPVTRHQRRRCGATESHQVRDDVVDGAMNGRFRTCATAMTTPQANVIDSRRLTTRPFCAAGPRPPRGVGRGGCPLRTLAAVAGSAGGWRGPTRWFQLITSLRRSASARTGPSPGPTAEAHADQWRSRPSRRQRWLGMP